MASLLDSLLSILNLRSACYKHSRTTNDCIKIDNLQVGLDNSQIQHEVQGQL